MQNQKILHVSGDEKFLDYARWQFDELYPEQNKYVIITSKKLPEDLVYINNLKNIELLPKNSNSLKILQKYADISSLIVLHGLNDFRSKLVLKSNKNNKFLWLFWGGEIYNNYLTDLPSPFGRLTQWKFAKSRYIIGLKRFVVNGLFRFFPQKSQKLSVVEAAKKIDYFGNFIIEEYNLLRNLEIIHADHFKFSYGNIEFLMNNDLETQVNGTNILVGNSAMRTNNHLEAFELLKNIELKGHKVIAPLSYGEKKYGSSINKLGKKIIGDNFKSLIDFMPLEEYNKIIRSCGIVLMTQTRQQALGNILAMIWMGAKVYLNDYTTTYQYFERIGVKVYSIQEEFKKENDSIFVLPDQSIIDKNRSIILKEIGREVLMTEMKTQIDKIFTEK